MVDESALPRIASNALVCHPMFQGPMPVSARISILLLPSNGGQKHLATIHNLANSRVMTTPMSELRESLARHNSKFESLLALIPPEMYLEHEQDPDAVTAKFSQSFILTN